MDSAGRASWQPIDTTIVARDGGFAAMRVKTPLKFGKEGSTTLVAGAGKAGTAGIKFSRKLPAPRVERNRVEYRNAVAAGADLVVTALPDGFTQSVVLRSRPSESLTIRLPLTLPTGMSYGKTADGHPQLMSEAAAPVASPLAVQAVDARSEESPEAGRMDEVDATIETTDGQSTLILRPDAAFLADPAVTYPVTMSVASDWVGLGLPADAWVNKNNPTLSHASDTWLRAGTTSTSKDIARIYLRYVINGTDLDYARIINADLLMWNYRSGAPAGSSRNCGLQVGSGIVARQLTSQWSPATISWTNQPRVTINGQSGNQAAYSDTEGCSGGGELLHSIEPIVQSWADGSPDYGLLLQAVSETDVINWRQYRSSEGGSWDREDNHAPILFVQYEPAPSEVIPFAYTEDRSNWPTYEEAKSLKIRSESSVPNLPGVSESQIPAIQSRLEYPYHVNRNQLQPLPGEDWSVPDPEDDGEKDPPVVTETVPLAEAADVPQSSKVSAAFSEPIWGGRLTLKNAEGKDVQGTSAITTNRLGVVFTPGAQLPNGRYTATVSDAADEWSNPMDAPFTWSFTVGPLPAVPVLSQLSAIPSVASAPTPTTSSTTPSLQAQADDADGRAMTVEFQVEHAPEATGQGTGLIWAGSVVNVAAGTMATAKIPADKLANGHRVRWRARAIAGTSSSPWSDWQPLTVDLPKPTISSLIITPGSPTDSGTEVTSLTPTLQALPDDPLGGTLKVEYEVEHDPSATAQGSGSIWSTAVDGLPSGQRTQVQVPAGKLNDGWKVRWRARATAGGLSSAWSGWQLFTVELPVPILAGLDVMPSKTSGEVRQTTSLVPELQVLVRDPSGAASKVEYEVEHDPSATAQGSGSIWSTAVDNIASGDLAKAQVPAGKLNDGWKVRWRVRATAGGLSSAWSGWQLFTVELPVPILAGLDVMPSKTSGEVRQTTSLVPELQVLVRDPSGAASKVEYEVEHDPSATAQGSGSIWSTAVDNIASGDLAKAQVPAGKLNDGWKVRWRVRATAGGLSSAWSGWQLFTVELPDPSIADSGVTPSTLVNGMLTTGSDSPFLNAWPVDPAGRTMRVEYQLAGDPDLYGEDSLKDSWTGAVEGITSGERASLVVPPTQTRGATRVVWRARVVIGDDRFAWSSWQKLAINLPDSEPNPATGITGVRMARSYESGGEAVTISTTPTFEAFSDTDYGRTVEFEVEHDPLAAGQGAGKIWSTTASPDEDGPVNYVLATVPQGLLQDGWKIRWRVRLVSDDGALDWTEWQNVTINAHDLIIDELDFSPRMTVGGKHASRSLTPYLYTSMLDPADSGAMRIEYEVRHDPNAPAAQGSGPIWSTAVDAHIEEYEESGDPGKPVSQYGWAEARVPSGMLAAGWTVQWRARAVSANGASTWSGWIRMEVAPAGPICCDVWTSLHGRDPVGNQNVLLTTTPSYDITSLDLGGTATGFEIQLEHSPDAPAEQGAGLIWSTTVSIERDGAYGWATITVPEGTLRDGWDFRWRVRAIGTGVPSAWTSWSDEKLRVTRPVIDHMGVGPYELIDGVRTVQSLTPYFDVNIYDWEGFQSAYYEIQVEHAPDAPAGQGTGSVWSLPQSDGASWVEMPEGLLQDGWLLRWRARVVMNNWKGVWAPWQEFVAEVPAPKIMYPDFAPRTGESRSTSLQPTFAVMPQDPLDRSSTVQYQLEHDPAAGDTSSSGLIWSAGQENVCSYCWSEVQVPADVLSYGWAMRWRARAVADDGTEGRWTSWRTIETNLLEDFDLRSSEVIGDRTIATSITPLLDAVLAGSPETPGAAEFEVEHDPSAPQSQGSGLIWSGVTEPVDCRCTAYTEVPSHTLGYQWKVRWRARAIIGDERGRWSPWKSFDAPDLVVDLTTVRPSETTSGTTVTSSLTPSLGAYVADYDDRMFSVDFEVAHDPKAPADQGEGLIWRHTATNVCSACPADADVPEGKLQDGWQVHWRARARAGDTVGVWSAWSRLTVDVPDTDGRPMSAEPKPSLLAAQASSGGFNYERVDVAGCNSRRLSDWDYAYKKEGYVDIAPYTVCYSKWIGWGEYKFKWITINGVRTLVPVPQVKNGRRVEATVVMHSYAGNTSGLSVMNADETTTGRLPRDIVVWTNLERFEGLVNWKPSDIYDEQYWRLDFKHEEGDASSCDMIQGKNRRDTIGNWRKNGYNRFVFRSTGTTTDTCTIRPWLTYEDAWTAGDSVVALWNRPEDKAFTDDRAPVFRCDSKKRGAPAAFYTGGCVFVGARPVLDLYTGDSRMSEVVGHIQTALYNPSQTHPKTSTDGTRLRKRIPGNLLAHTIDMPVIPLTFLDAKTKGDDGVRLKGRNSSVKTRECARLVREEGIDTTGKECDEYPFASTYEGAGRGDWNFSVKYVTKAHNKDHGNYLKAFYARYRIADKDQFYVKIVEGQLT
ncbi:DNRLRE domain-containing protein [Streptosporangium sandarakinum]|uniref:DNRLRE domain-containing protein n=1 Tax=Streptosporangium sandarakinum TaxID=1260955 RepID=UPI00368C98AC